MVDYNLGKPVGLVEYKHYKAQIPNLKHPTYRALIELASLARLPFMVVFYWPDVWAFRVIPVNEKARETFKLNEEVSEQEFVRRLYAMRARVVDAFVLKRLNTQMPPNETATDPRIGRESASDQTTARKSPVEAQGSEKPQPTKEAPADKSAEAKSSKLDDLPF